MNVTIQMLRAFKTAAETQNFTRAAELCYMTQPAFSRLIQGCEKLMGVQLFERTTRSVCLTLEGQLCLRRVQQILDSYDLMLCEISSVKSSVSTEFRVGYNPVSGPPDFFIRALKRLQEQYPHVNISLTRTYSGQLAQQLEEKQLDCALVSCHYITPEMHLCQKPLQPIFLYALVHRSSPLTQKKLLTFTDLTTAPLVFMKNTAPLTRKSVLKQFAVRQLPFTEDAPAEDLDEMMMRIRIGNAIGISSFCDPDCHYPDIAAMQLEGFACARPDSCRVLSWHEDALHPCLTTLFNILDDLSTEPSRNGIFPFD